MDFDISPEEALLIEAAERFGQKRLRPAERAHEAVGAYPRELQLAYEEAGFARLDQPESLGGAGLELARALPIWSRLAAADPSAPLALAPWWPGAAALAESGVDLAHTRGAIAWTGCAGSELAWLPRERCDFLVCIDDDGVTIIEGPHLEPTDRRPCGLQACGSTRLARAAGPARRLGGPELAREVLTAGRLFVSALLLGAARDTHAAAAAYAQERVAFGRPIAHHQGLAFQLADAATALDAAELFLQSAARSSRPWDAAQAQALMIDTAQQVCERSLQALGGHGYLHDHRVEKRMRDARSLVALWGGKALAERDAAAGAAIEAGPVEIAS